MIARLGSLLSLAGGQCRCGSIHFMLQPAKLSCLKSSHNASEHRLRRTLVADYGTGPSFVPTGLSPASIQKLTWTRLSRPRTQRARRWKHDTKRHNYYSIYAPGVTRGCIQNWIFTPSRFIAENCPYYKKTTGHVLFQINSRIPTTTYFHAFP